MKILNKFVWSSTEPQNKNDVWFDGSVFKLYNKGEWEAFTIDIETANEIKKLIGDDFNGYQKKLTAGSGIEIENNVISTKSIFQLVDELPSVGDTNTIYFVASSNDSDSKLTEWVYVGNSWEKLGEGGSAIEGGSSGVTILLPNDSTFAEDVADEEFLAHNQETYAKLYDQSDKELSVSMQYFGHNILCNPTMRVRFVNDGVNPYYDYCYVLLHGNLIETGQTYRLYSDGKVAKVKFNGDIIIGVNGKFNEDIVTEILYGEEEFSPSGNVIWNRSNYTQSKESPYVTLGDKWQPFIATNGTHLIVGNLFGSENDSEFSLLIGASWDKETNIITVEGGWTHPLLGPIDDDIQFKFDPITQTLTTVEETITLAGWATIKGYKLTRTNFLSLREDNLTEYLANKVDKEAGKGLSSNDFTDEDKEKLDGINKSLVFNVDALGDEDPIFSIDSHIFFSTEQVEKAVGVSFEELWKYLEEKPLDLLHGSVYYGIIYSATPFAGSQGCTMHYQTPDKENILILNILKEPTEVESGVFARGVLSLMSSEGSGLVGEVVSSTEPTDAFPQVLYVEQTLTEEQKSVARRNIGAINYDDTEVQNDIDTLQSSVAEQTLLLGGLAKRGIVKQTQTWIEASDGGYDYVMSNQVWGSIPQANIDLFVSAGAVFNEESGYFELNGLTDISYQEMQNIHNYTNPFSLGVSKEVALGWNLPIRTAYALKAKRFNIFTTSWAYFFWQSVNLEKLVFEDVVLTNNLQFAFNNCNKLAKIDGVFSIAGISSAGSINNAFFQCYSLEDVRLMLLKVSVSFESSPRLSTDSILYMIENEIATSAITITLHATAYARAMADAEIVAALEAHPNVSLASA